MRMGDKRVVSQKLSSRYRLTKIDEKFYVIDFADARSIKTYLSIFTSYKNSWNAWEISKDEVNKKFNGFHPAKGQRELTLLEIALLGGLGRRLFPHFPVIEFDLSMPIKVFLLIGVLVILALGIIIAQKVQRGKTLEFKNKVKIHSKSKISLVFHIALAFIYFLFVYGMLYSILCMETIDVLYFLLFLFLVYIFIFMKFIAYPVNAATYGIEKIDR